MEPAILLIAMAVAFAASLAGTAWLRRYLVRRQMLDMPNARSNHKRPTPRGGGLVVVALMLGTYGMLGTTLEGHFRDFYPLMAGFGLLAVISWLDDRRPLPARWRLVAQLLAVALVLYERGLGGLVFQGLLPVWLDTLLAGLAWLWFVNLYNFMDGIDGITGSETVCIALGITAIGLLIPLGDSVYYAALLVPVMLGFLRYNWHPASLFIGDVGSIPLGFLLGWLLLSLAAQGQWAAALILPGYYLADSTYTLLRRFSQGKRVWEAHSEHFYQKAVRSGLRHDQVVRRILLANVILLAAALGSVAAPGWTPLLFAIAVSVVLLLLYALNQAHNKNA